MNLDNIKALADILNIKGLSAIEVGEGEHRIRIERELSAVNQQTKPAATPSKTTEAQAPEATAPIIHEGLQLGNLSDDITGNLTEIKSPLVGVYYAAPSPDAETFVSIGSKVKKGDVLCIIETMKLMNEITAEQDGEIMDICIKNGDIAEFGQILFKMV